MVYIKVEFDFQLREFEAIEVSQLFVMMWWQTNLLRSELSEKFLLMSSLMRMKKEVRPCHCSWPSQSQHELWKMNKAFKCFLVITWYNGVLTEREGDEVAMFKAPAEVLGKRLLFFFLKIHEALYDRYFVCFDESNWKFEWNKHTKEQTVFGKKRDIWMKNLSVPRYLRGEVRMSQKSSTCNWVTPLW